MIYSDASYRPAAAAVGRGFLFKLCPKITNQGAFSIIGIESIEKVFDFLCVQNVHHLLLRCDTTEMTSLGV
jgi:hypothetical protein